ncbi:FAD-dependent monooxygenase [Streptomyces sp. NPDC013157]|uniref:FAD-dependent monooxygenase n=1 Tax=Streptomyces sp. NPDC013157 TaxID=3364861 RepID=UPI00368A90FB
MSVRKVLVVGGGITGSVLSLALAQRGVEVDLVEIAPAWSGVGHGITIQGNALKALRSVGVLDRILEHAVTFDLVRMRRADGELIAEIEAAHTGGADLPSTAGALRSDLQNALCEAVYAQGVTVHLGVSVQRLEQSADTTRVTFTDGTTGHYDLVVGADGTNSQMRSMIGIDARPKPVGMSIFRVVAARPPELDCSELYYGGPRYKAGYTPIAADQCYAFPITRFRTAATSALAADALSPAGPLRVGVIGSGFEAQNHVRALAALRELSSVTVFSPNPASRARFTERLADLGLPLGTAESAAAAVEGADLVLCAARSWDEQPTLREAPAGSTVASIGSALPEQRELGVEVLARADLIVADMVDEVAHDTGDLLAAEASGVDCSDKIVSLADVVSGRVAGRSGPDSLVVYKSVGSVVQELAVASMCAWRAGELSLGTTLPVTLSPVAK